VLRPPIEGVRELAKEAILGNKSDILEPEDRARWSNYFPRSSSTINESIQLNLSIFFLFVIKFPLAAGR
jgi:hypothetical protein